jgi:uncharacterized protein (TIGR03435 family)
MELIQKGLLGESGVKVEGSYLRARYRTLQQLIAYAYGLRNPQVILPEALESMDVFNVDAKLPAGAAPDQAPLMLRALLAERFRLVAHPGERQAAVYWLTVAKNGPKFSARKPGAQPEPPPQEGEQVRKGPGNSYELRSPGGLTRVIPGSGIHIEATTISGLLSSLKQWLDLPAIDRTGLSGEYDIKMDIGLEALGATDEALPRDGAATLNSIRANCLAAVKGLGLELARQMAREETLVVESALKTPVAN